MSIFSENLKNVIQANFGLFWPKSLKTRFFPQLLFMSILTLCCVDSCKKLKEFSTRRFSIKLGNPHYLSIFDPFDS